MAAGVCAVWPRRSCFEIWRVEQQTEVHEKAIASGYTSFIRYKLPTFLLYATDNAEQLKIPVGLMRKHKEKVRPEDAKVVPSG